MYKNLYRLGYLNYLVLFIFAIIFYKERTVFLDIAFHLFFLLKDGAFTIQNYRYGAVFTQAFPLMASRLSLPLSGVMLSYSIGFIVYYTACYWICGSILKNYRMALVLLCCNILFVSDTFYWMQSEMPQGIAFMAVAFAYLEKFKQGDIKKLPLLLLAILASGISFFHPLLVFPVFFSVAFFVLSANIRIDWRAILFFGIVFIMMYLVKKMFLSNPYDDSAMDRLKNIKYMFPHYLGITSNRTFLAACVNKYYWLPFCAGAVCIAYIYQRKWQNLLLFLAAFMGYLLMINISYPHSTEPAFYMENLYLPLGAIVGLPFIYDVLSLIKNVKLVYTFMMLVILTGLTRVYLTHDIYAKRLNWERAFLDKHIDEKLFIYNKPEYQDILLMSWGTAYEFWLLSTSEYGRTASIIIPDNPAAVFGWTTEQNSFITNWGAYHYPDFKGTYFIFRDTTTHYKVLE